MEPPINDSFEDFKVLLNKDDKLQEKFKADPVQAVNSINVQNPKDTDKWIYRIIVLAFGFAIILIVSGLIVLTFNKVTLDDKLITIFTAISSGAIGALAGLLAPSPTRQ